MDRSGEYADQALNRFIKAHKNEMQMNLLEWRTHIAEWFHGEIEKAYKAGSADATRKESEIDER